MITSKNNDYVKHARSLYSTKNRKKYQQFVVEGSHLVDEAIKCGLVEYILSTDNKYEGYLISDEVMHTISEVNNLSVLAVCRMNENDINEIDLSRVLVLESINDPGNIGTLIRSAVAFNFTAIICSKDCVDIYNEKVIRATQGMIFYIPVIYLDVIEYLKDSTNLTIATDLNGDSEYLDIIDNVNLIIGNEGRGLSKDVIDLSDKTFCIEMNEKVESLNAAVAGSILMWMIGGKK